MVDPPRKHTGKFGPALSLAAIASLSTLQHTPRVKPFDLVRIDAGKERRYHTPDQRKAQREARKTRRRDRKRTGFR